MEEEKKQTTESNIKKSRTNGYDKSDMKRRRPDDRRDSPRGSKIQIPKFIFKKKKCRLCENKIKEPDYKDVELLSKFYTARGKILPRRLTGCCAKHQRKVKTAIKRARYMALLPYARIETLSK